MTIKMLMLTRPMLSNVVAVGRKCLLLGDEIIALKYIYSDTSRSTWKILLSNPALWRHLWFKWL